MHKVEPPQRVTRALAVYEYTGTLDHPTAARLVPVSLFIYGHFEDAGIFLARPVPFALGTGDIYFVEKAGDHLGTFDVDLAGHIVTNNALADDNPEGAWYGFGTFNPPPPPSAVRKLPASTHLPVIAGSDDDSRPQLIRRDPPKTASTSTPSHTPSSTGDSGQPSMTRRDPPTSTTDDSSTSADDRPTLRHRDDTQKPAKHKRDKPQASVSGDGDLFDDPDRPTLGAGKPDAADIPQLHGLPADLHQAVAISDPANRDPHIFTRDWDSSTDREQTLTQLEALARPRIAAYLAANKLQPVAPGAIPSTPTATASTAPESPLTTAARDDNDQGPPQLITKADADKANAAKPAATPKPSTTTTKPPTAAVHTTHRHTTPRRVSGPTPLALTNEQLNGYQLTYGGLPTFTYTAETPVATGGPVYITLVAQRLPSGELQLAFHSLTDAAHLDRTPWFRPIDVVDPDASHRASLLFELRAQHSRQFALYRLVTAEAEPTFTTGLIE
jgi:hypothetical protein